ncbi:CDP-alcohol phosphatidyltransferase family protein [Flagellimonas sp.]|uniref:CDP-alcohol phosphatidyltransferase family protein n=1 Tax=Flagellimonas sp. TaxID=2058762 RepID=UPI003F4A15EC
MKRHIPNFITLLNLLSGCIAVVFAVLNKLEIAAFFVFLGIFFDFLDGLAARLLKVQSEIGVQLDSLADMVTSGVVPGIVMFQLLNMAETGGWQTNETIANYWSTLDFSPISLVGFVITLASAYRLAKFNIDENQVSSFIGLPTPANTLLILSLPLILLYHNNDVLNGIILNEWFLIALTLLSAFLLNANIELFALKFKSWQFKGNEVRYLFLIGSFVLLLTLKFLAVPVIIILYVLTSLLSKTGGRLEI